MLNMPAEHGGTGPLDARPGRARGGVRQGDERARLRRRRPWPARAARDRHPRAGRAVRGADRPRRVSRGVGADRARRGLGPLRHEATRRPRRRRLGAERREVVRHERGRPGLLHRRRGRRRRADALPRRAGRARARDRADAALPPRPVPRPPSRARPARLPGARTRTASPASGDAGAKEWFLVERLFIAARCCGAAERLLDLATAWAQEREAFGAPIAEYQGVSFPLADSLTELLAARLLTYHAAHAFDELADRKIVHGKVSMAKLYASEMAGRVADRALQILGGRGYMHREPGRPLLPRAPRRPDLGGHERDPAADHRARALKRGAAPYLD